MKSKISFIITDTHFGVKQNSATWINSQLDFIYNQLIPHIQQCKDSGLYDKIRLIHMGDVFDSRSTISTMIATKVVEAFKKLVELCGENNIYIVAGNHDFYSPNSDTIDSLSLLLKNLNINLCIQDILHEDNDLFIPWYQWGSNESNELIESGRVKNIFTHADIVTEPIPYLHTKNINIFSGHLHIPSIKKNLYNLGSCYALNFADANHDRGYYTIIDDNKPEFHPNNHSIRFWRLYNEDIFNSKKFKLIRSGDYVELYISQSNMSIPEYIEKINKYTQELKNIWVIPQTETILNEDMEKFEGYDIEKITERMIPTELKDKFKMVLNYTKI